MLISFLGGGGALGPGPNCYSNCSVAELVIELIVDPFKSSAIESVFVTSSVLIAFSILISLLPAADAPSSSLIVVAIPVLSPSVVPFDESAFVWDLCISIDTNFFNRSKY